MYETIISLSIVVYEYTYNRRLLGLGASHEEASDKIER